MNHRVAAYVATLVAFCGTGATAAQFTIGVHNFILPEGFKIELVSATNLVQRPVEADFDEEGRLYVTESSGSNDKIQKQLEEKPHRVVTLHDSDNDGRFDRSKVFADAMAFPEGAMWRDGSLYVAAPPSIWKLTDTNGDGTADVRTEWFQGKTLTGCANDLHGPYDGRDGWIYWCKGAFAKQTYTLPNGKEFTTRASHIFRARPDGTGIEPVMTGGMDNPVGFSVLPSGERFFSGTFFLHPQAGKRDGLIHALYGGLYGKVHDVIDDHVRTGELLPTMTHLGPAAPAGLTIYESKVFGAEFEGNLFTACFNLRKVTRHVLKAEGSTFTTADSDFVVSDNPDFHPTDVLEDADGSLIVIDTGGWYKLCCPTSQLYKPDVLGAIYRVRRIGAPAVEDPRGRRLRWEERKSPAALVELLGDSRLAVRKRAVEMLGKTGEAAVSELRGALGNRERARAAVWALSRVDSPRAREAVRTALMSPDETVRSAAAHSIAAWRDRGALGALLGATTGSSPQAMRAMVEAIGRLGDPIAIPRLFALSTTADRALEHSIIYALVELNEAASTRTAITSGEAAVRRAALIALDQMPGKLLRATDVIPLLTATNAVLKETASWIVGRHPEWGDALAHFFTEEFRNTSTPSRVAELQSQLTPMLRNGTIQSTTAELLRDATLPKTSRLALLQAMARSGLKDLPDTWAAAISDALQAPDGDVVREAVAVTRAMLVKQAEVRSALAQVAKDSRHGAEVRLNAAAAADELSPELFAFARASLAPAQPLSVRSTAAGIMSRARLRGDQLEGLLPAVHAATPLELPRLLSAFGKSKDEALGMKLVATLKGATALPSLRPETLLSALTNFPASVKQQAQPLAAALNADAAKEQKHIESLLGTLKGGDIRRGQALFNSDKTACAACHAIGYLGGAVGPDLTRIGQVRTERDLLEAVVYPSASFVRSYEPMLVSTKDGEEYSGVLRKDSPDEVVLATGPNTEQRIPRSDITDMRPGNVSVMPSGLADQLTKEELADLVAFLRATRW